MIAVGVQMKSMIVGTAALLIPVASMGCGSSSTPAAPTVTVTGVSVSGPTPAIGGPPQQFTATAAMSNGTSKDVTSSASWQSSDTTIATVSSSGIVTAV